MKNVKNYFIRNLTALDQLAHTLVGGEPDETISARCWRERNNSRFWRFMRKIVDTLFFWEKDHCEMAYYNELNDIHKPGEYRRGM